MDDVLLQLLLYYIIALLKERYLSSNPLEIVSNPFDPSIIKTND